MTNTNTNTKKSARRIAGETNQKSSPPRTKPSSRRNSASTSTPSATRARRAALRKTDGIIAPHPTKKQVCLTLLSRREGASIEELKSATGWQTHSVRGFLSGEVRKRMARQLASVVTEQGERRYLLA